MKTSKKLSLGGVLAALANAIPLPPVMSLPQVPAKTRATENRLSQKARRKRARWTQ